MIKSMTGFAQWQTDYEQHKISWEIKSLNSRYLEANFYCPEFLRSLEPLWREKLKSFIIRGKVDCSLRISGNVDPHLVMEINEPLLQSLLQAKEKILALFPQAAAPTWLEILNGPGVLQTVHPSNPEFQTTIHQGFETCLAQLVHQREQEGAQLAHFIAQRLTALEQIIQQIKNLVPEILENQKKHILQRLKEISIEPDPNRLAQEMVYSAQKMDIAEELDRLTVHSAEVNRLLHTSGSIGQQLNFLMQELNREANTIGSKSVDARTSQESVQLKVIIEQMREQIQNVE